MEKDKNIISITPPYFRITHKIPPRKSDEKPPPLCEYLRKIKLLSMLGESVSPEEKSFDKKLPITKKALEIVSQKTGETECKHSGCFQCAVCLKTLPPFMPNEILSDSIKTDYASTCFEINISKNNYQAFKTEARALSQWLNLGWEI